MDKELSKQELKKEKAIPRGAVIPYIIHEGEIRMLFMVPSDPKYGGSDWQIAKGKIEEGETSEQGAFREAQEELGLFMPNVLSQHHLGKFGTITAYVAKVEDHELFGEPDDEVGGTRWMTPEEFAKEGRDWQKPIVKAAARLVRKKETSLDEQQS